MYCRTEHNICLVGGLQDIVAIPGFPSGDTSGEESACRYRRHGSPWVKMEEELATHSSILAWKIPCAEEPGGLRSVGPRKVDRTETLSAAS